MSRYALVDVKLITTNTPRSAFQEAQIEQLADQILESEGLLKPLIVKQTGLEDYLLLDGDLEYYAAVKAREKDPRKGEMVNAFVILPKQEEIITKQLQTLKQAQGSVDAVPIIRPLESAATITAIQDVHYRLKAVEENVKEIQEFPQKLEEIVSRVLQGLLPQALEGLLNQSENMEGKQNAQESIDPLQLLNELPEEELAMRLGRSKIAGAGQKAKDIVKARSKKANQKFADYGDVVQSVKGIADKTMLRIIDDWSR